MLVRSCRIIGSGHHRHWEEWPASASEKGTNMREGRETEAGSEACVIVAAFDGIPEVAAALDALVAAGFRQSEISILGDHQALIDRKSTRLNSSHYCTSRMPSSA